MRQLSDIERAELQKKIVEHQRQRVKRIALHSEVGKERIRLDKVVSPVLGVVTWFSLKGLGLHPTLAFFIGALVGYVFGPALAWILQGMPKEPSRSDKNHSCTRK